jgi:hypothetical protein
MLNNMSADPIGWAANRERPGSQSLANFNFWANLASAVTPMFDAGTFTLLDDESHQ